MTACRSAQHVVQNMPPFIVLPAPTDSCGQAVLLYASGTRLMHALRIDWGTTIAIVCRRRLLCFATHRCSIQSIYKAPKASLPELEQNGPL